MHCKFQVPYADNLGHKINRQMIHTLVKCQLLQQLLIYHQANIVDETNHILGDQGDLTFQPFKKKKKCLKIILINVNINSAQY